MPIPGQSVTVVSVVQQYLERKAARLPSGPVPASDMREYIDSLKESFLLPYPAIWDSLGVDRSRVKAKTLVGVNGVLIFDAPDTNIVITVSPDGVHAVEGLLRGGIKLNKRFPFRPRMSGVHRGTQGDISHYIEDMLPVKVVYKVYGLGSGAKVYHDVAGLIRAHGPQTGTAGGSLRKELQGQPILKDLAGPMWDGREGDEVAVRYETYALNEILSRA